MAALIDEIGADALGDPGAGWPAETTTVRSIRSIVGQQLSTSAARAI